MRNAADYFYIPRFAFLCHNDVTAAQTSMILRISYHIIIQQCYTPETVHNFSNNSASAVQGAIPHGSSLLFWFIGCWSVGDEKNKTILFS